MQLSLLLVGETKMRAIITLFLFVISFNISTAQIIGQIFDKDFANEEFGKVLSSVEINSVSLTSLLDSAGE